MVMIRKMKDSGIEWIGEIPEGWSIAQLKRFVIVNNGREIENEIYRSDSAIPVYGSGGVFKYTDSFMYDGKSVLFGRKGTLGKPLYVEGRFWTVDTMYFLTFKGGLHPKYNYYQLSAFDWEPHITKTALPSVVASEIVACSFPFPSLPEQQKIADFLDAECARIDAVIEQTRASIEEYKKLKQSVITQAVTKGIRPGRKMKDSGVEWIGEIPEEWTLYITKAIAKRIVVGVVIKPADYFDDTGTVPFLRGINVKEYRVNNSPMVYINETTNQILSKSVVHAGDILVVRDGSIGVSAAVPEEYDGANVVSMIIVTCNDLVLPDYLCYSLNSDVGKTQFNLSKIGTALTHTSVHSVSNLLHVVPPIEEQIEIKNAIKSKLNFFDNLIRSKETIISELESYKKCLIYEYVTGKKEVGQ